MLALEPAQQPMQENIDRNENQNQQRTHQPETEQQVFFQQSSLGMGALIEQQADAVLEMRVGRLHEAVVVFRDLARHPVDVLFRPGPFDQAGIEQRHMVLERVVDGCKPCALDQKTAQLPTRGAPGIKK